MDRGWGALPFDNQGDLSDWQDLLGQRFKSAPWVEMHESKIILRSSDLNLLGTSEEVRSHAIELISLLNGALALSEGSRPVSFGGVAEFTPKGVRYIVHGEMHSEVRMKVRAIGVACGSDGNPLPHIPQPSAPQKWAATADSCEVLRDALIYFGRPNSWFDIYKCIECVEVVYGGEHRLRKAKDSNGQIKRMKETANFFRHHRTHKPQNLMDIKDARKLLSSLLQDVLNDKEAAT